MSRGAVAARLAVAVAALAALGWFAVLERGVRLEARGDAIAQDLDAPRAVQRAQSAFRGARALDPDTTPEVKLAFVYQEARERDRARALLEDVVRREPANLTAWGVLFTFTRDPDPATAARARAAARELNPLGAAGARRGR